MRFQFEKDVKDIPTLRHHSVSDGNTNKEPRSNTIVEEQAIKQKKILILSVSAGAGHIRAAEALRAYSILHDASIAATHVDVMNYVSTSFKKIYTDFYITLISKHPALWGYLYQRTNDAMPNSIMQKLRRSIERLNTRNLLKEISAFNPDAIICTHFLPAEILARMIRISRIACPVWVQVTDFDLHRMWVHDGMAGYFAANDEVAFRMHAQGIPKEIIHVTGIPVMPTFDQPLERVECANELALDPKRLTFLLMGGGAGLGKLDEVAARLLAIDSDFQLIVLAGKNEDALAALRMLSIRYPDRLVACGFTNHVERLMACADLVITKPGGLTVSECLSMGLPMIVNSPIPGQEERNADYLLEQGVALKAFDAITLEYRILHLLQNPDKLAEMRAKAKAIGRPAAAQRVLDVVLHVDQSGLI
ncbi:MAG TPA: glycosyltransferase [Burkholderiaceae bacterium]|jgi:processive 1,2-diacylglycerol beta-glucosyltransferase